VEVALQWERRLWSGRPTFFLPRVRGRGDRYVLTDVRLLRLTRLAADRDEIAVCDIGDVHRAQSPIERLLGVSTIEVRPRNPRRPSLVLHGVRRGSQLAAVLELLSADSGARLNAASIRAALAIMTWEPRVRTAGTRGALSAIAAVAIALLAVVVGLHGTNTPITYPAHDAIYPNGQKAARADIVQFMQRTVMPWAREALGPIVGDPARVTCKTCHGPLAESSNWHMPAVAALPRPAVREAGWENYGGVMDAQMRNAIYGYGAESDKATRAAYMREVVMPGMAQLLGRPAYDFTRPYEFNRSRFTFGCYHCHKVK
jgi:hypothetical protein